MPYEISSDGTIREITSIPSHINRGAPNRRPLSGGPNNQGNTWTFWGDILTDSSYHGRGRLLWSNGDFYYGDFRDGIRTGVGMYMWGDGGSYLGEFVSAKRHGYGKRIYANGTISEGYWNNDIFVGGEGESPYSFGVLSGNSQP